MKTMQSLKRLGGVALCTIALQSLTLSSALAQAATKPPILIGQSVALSGPTQAAGISFRDGALLYFDYINKQGGINGRPIELVVADDEGDAAKTTVNTKKLIEEDKVVALFGYVGAASANAGIALATQSKVPLIGPASGSPAIHKVFNRYVFNVRASYADEVEYGIELIAKQGLTRFGVLYQDDAFGKAVLGHVKESLAKRKMVAEIEVAVPVNAVNVSQQSKQMIAKDLHGVIVAVPYAAAGSFIKDMRNAARAAMFINVSSVGTQELRDTLRDQGRGVQMLNVVPSPWDASYAIVRTYQQRMNEIGRTDRFYSFSNLEGFIAAHVLVAGLRKAGRSIDRESLINGLETVNESFGGYNVAFSANNHNGSKFVEFVIINRDGKFFK
jgi:branched-chain amino acid transport system substrate-binding protein